MRTMLSLSVVMLGLCGAVVAGEPQREYQDRNTPVALEATAQEFFGLVDLHRSKDLDAVRALLEKTEYPAALKEFQLYYLKKLRYSDIICFPTEGVSPPLSGLAAPGKEADIMKKAENLMANILTADKGDTLPIGEPGTVDWKTPVAQGWGAFPWHVSAFNPLLGAYVLTGERRYLDKWAACADDWAINQIYGVRAYNHMYYGENAAGLELLRRHRPSWMSMEWEQELRDNMRMRGRFLLHHLTPAGQDPIAHRADVRFRATNMVDVRESRPDVYLSGLNTANMQTYLPELFEEPENARIVHAMLYALTHVWVCLLCTFGDGIEFETRNV